MERLAEPHWPAGAAEQAAAAGAAATTGQAAVGAAGSDPRLSLMPRFRYSSRPAEEDC